MRRPLLATGASPQVCTGKTSSSRLNRSKQRRSRGGRCLRVRLDRTGLVVARLPPGVRCGAPLQAQFVADGDLAHACLARDRLRAETIAARGASAISAETATSVPFVRSAEGRLADLLFGHLGENGAWRHADEKRGMAPVAFPAAPIWRACRSASRLEAEWCGGRVAASG